MQIPALMFTEGGWCEALKTSYQPGRYQPKTVAEYNALCAFAHAAPLEEEATKDALIAQAFALGVGTQSALARMNKAQLAEAIATAKEAKE